MRERFGAGFHAAPGKSVDAAAYEQWTGRWSRLFVPSVIRAAELSPGFRVLDVSTFRPAQAKRHLQPFR
jgi:hypothetical protein